MGFALELSRRLTTHQTFQDQNMRLHREAAIRTLPEKLQAVSAPISLDGALDLLYCANVFAQTDDEAFRTLAQTIALNLVLTGRPEIPLDRTLRLLSDLGNFPALAYAERRSDTPNRSLADQLRRVVSRELNTIEIGAQKFALTDFQKQTWDSLPTAKALAVSAPTSTGKSFLVIEHLCRSALKAPSFNAVYLAPTRALLSEVYSKIKIRLEGEESVRISTIPTLDAEASARQIFILTQERMQVLLAVSSMSFDMIVADEAQNLSDGARGMILQECLEQALERNGATRLVMLAPGVEGYGNVEAAIGLENITSSTSFFPSVIQNRILVRKSRIGIGLDLSLLTSQGAQTLGVLRSKRGFDLAENRLAAVALELGQTGGSLVYATGPSNSEKVALQIGNGRKVLKSEKLANVADFIEKHIHPRYGLAALVRKGVAFHYGKMPTLLREALETSFKEGDLGYLVCTTTLFQGVNLPARNVFIDTPTRGSGSKLDPAALWNFAGRAGRMNMDVVGNVFLVDYEDWPEKPMNDFIGYRIEPAFGQTLYNYTPAVLAALNGEMPRISRTDESLGKVRAAAGLMISRAAKGDVKEFVDRALGNLNQHARRDLTLASRKAITEINLPSSLLETNWTVNPFGLRRLYDNLSTKVANGDLDQLIPLNPHSLPRSQTHYASIFMRMQREINQDTSRFPAVVAGTAVQWMEGKPYPVLLAREVTRRLAKFKEKKEAFEREKRLNPLSRKRPPKPVDVNGVIRAMFEMIEDIIRFQYVQLGKAYIDVLALVMREQGHQERVKNIFDFPLALELGVATKSGWSFMELGLSRIAASALQPHFPDTNLTVSEAREWLKDVDLQPLKLNSIIVEELQRLKLVQAA